MNKNKKKFTVVASLALTAVAFLLCATPVLASDITPENLGYLINQERTYYGLRPLKIDTNLDDAANQKVNDMMSRNYFEHYAFGLTPWDFISKAHYNYLYAGENLAMDFQTSEGMVNAWMNSDLHRANILNPDFEDMGIGIVKGVYTENGQPHETTIVTNMFGRQKPAIVEFFNNMIQKISDLFSF